MSYIRCKFYDGAGRTACHAQLDAARTGAAAAAANQEV
jgi:hypothetical protein